MRPRFRDRTRPAARLAEHRPGGGSRDPAGERPRGAARDFLAFLAARPRIEGGPTHPLLDPDASDLLGDLLGATLVDAQAELATACKAVDGGGPAAAQGLAWLSEPPPWPPASVAKLLARGGDRALAMVQDLAGQIAPDPALRFWLVQSWLRPGRPSTVRS